MSTARKIIDPALVKQAVTLTILGAGTSFGLLFVLVAVISSFRLRAGRLWKERALVINRLDVEQDLYRDKALAGAIAVIALIEESKRYGHLAD